MTSPPFPLPLHAAHTIVLDLLELQGGRPTGKCFRWELVPNSIKSAENHTRFELQQQLGWGDRCHLVVRFDGTQYFIKGDLWDDPSEEDPCHLFFAASEALLLYENDHERLYLHFGWEPE